MDLIIENQLSVDLQQQPELALDFRFAPYEGGTRMEITMRLQPHGPMRLLEPMMRRMVPEMLADLRQNARRGLDAADRARPGPPVG